MAAMTETSLQTVLGLAMLAWPVRLAIEAGAALATILAAFVLYRLHNRHVGAAGPILIGAEFVADILMHLVQRTSQLGLTLEALAQGLVLFFFGLIRLVLDLADYALPSTMRASNIFWDLILIVLYAVVLLVVLRATVHVDLTSLLATSAVISVIIGFALQDTLGNIFAGLSMQLQKPFEPGDWVHFGNYVGRVQLKERKAAVEAKAWKKFPMRRATKRWSGTTNACQPLQKKALGLVALEPERRGDSRPGLT